MNTIKVSVIIPVFNNEKHLSECLVSVTQQTLDQFEIIVVNDGSTDASASIISNHAVTDKRIHVLNLEKNMGVSVARNTGIEHAHGDYIVFIDADDYWLGNTLLETLYDRAVTDGSDLVRFGFCRQATNGRKIDLKTEPDRTLDLAGNNEWNISYSVWAILISTKLIKRYHARFVPDLIMGEDALFCCSLYCHATKLSIIDKVGYCYRVNLDSVNNVAWSKDKLFCTVRWFKLAIDAIRDSPICCDRPDILQCLIIERLQMLTDKLAPMAVELLDDDELDTFISAWSDCLLLIDHAFFEKRHSSNTPMQRYQSILDHVLSHDTSGLKDAISPCSEVNNSLHGYNKVTLTRQDATRIGQLLINIEQNNVLCDLGNGAKVSLSRNKAHQLAKRLLDNDKPYITLNFRK